MAQLSRFVKKRFVKLLELPFNTARASLAGRLKLLPLWRGCDGRTVACNMGRPGERRGWTGVI